MAIWPHPFTPSLRVSVKRPSGRAAPGPTGTVGADATVAEAHDPALQVLLELSDPGGVRVMLAKAADL